MRLLAILIDLGTDQEQWQYRRPNEWSTRSIHEIVTVGNDAGNEVHQPISKGPTEAPTFRTWTA